MFSMKTKIRKHKAYINFIAIFTKSLDSIVKRYGCSNATVWTPVDYLLQESLGAVIL